VAGPVTLPAVVGGTPVSSTWGQDVNIDIGFLLNKPTGRFTQLTVQSIPDSVWTPLSFNGESGLDNFGGHSTTTNTSRYVVQAGCAGVWAVRGVAWYTTSTGGARDMRVQVNGATVSGSAQGASPTPNTGPVSVAAFAQVSLAVGDYVEVALFQSSGSALSTSLADGTTSAVFEVEWVRAA
jgi:hypothetical protein